jgi:hypothetical protein
MTEENVKTEETVESDRVSRSAQTREKESRRKPWQPPSALDSPPAPPGFIHRWIRESILGQEDRTNMSKRMREGFEPVRAEEFPEFEAPVIDHGRYKGVIGVGGLILARIPEETANERNQYYKTLTADQMHAVDSDLMRESNPVMPLTEPKRQSSITFGNGSGKPES